MDQRVEICGTSRPDMNGKLALATDFHFCPADATQDRYTVLLDSGYQCKVRAAKVRAAPPAGGASRAKVKGHRERTVYGAARQTDGGKHMKIR